MCHARGVDSNSHLRLAAAIDRDPTDAGHAFHPLLDEILNQLPVGVDRSLVPGQTNDPEPGDRVVFRAGRIQCGFTGFVGIIADPVQPVGDQQQGLVHILINRELQG